MASILSFRQPQKPQNWTNEELAELYRVVDVLARAGVEIDTDMGLSDEGEPWFSFCRADTGDVIVHFSRIDGQFVAVSAATDTVVRGGNFRRVAEALVNRQPLILPAPSSGQKLFLHPSVILTALVATTLAQMKSWDGDGALALEDVSGGPSHNISDATFAETLKTAFIDALNLVLRGFTGPADAKHALAEHSGVTALGLGLGNLSLASVVAFAISVIQGSPLLDEAQLAEAAQAPADQADASTKNIVAAAAAPQISDNGTHSDTGAPQLPAENRESVAVKLPARDAAVSGAMEKPGLPDKSGAAASDDEGPVQMAQKTLPDKVIAHDAGIPAPAAKQAPENINADAPKAEPARNAVAVADHKADAAVALVLISDSADLHRFSFTEISREAIEIFFVRTADASAGGDAPLSISAGLPLAMDIESFTLSDPAAGRMRVNASDIVFAGGDPVAMARLNQITDFVNATDNRYSAPDSFPDLLNQYWNGDKALTIVVFDSDDLPLNIFSFTSNVLFVEESQLNGLAMDAADSGLQVDLANGGDLTLLGVINLSPAVEAA